MLHPAGQFDKAAQELEKAKGLQPANQELVEEHGRVVILQQQLEQALGAYHAEDFGRARTLFGSMMQVGVPLQRTGLDRRP